MMYSFQFSSCVQAFLQRVYPRPGSFALFTLLCALCSNLLADNSAPKVVRVLFLGDSLTAGYGVDREAAFPTIVTQQLTQLGFAVEAINAGISGSTSASAVSRLRWHLQSAPDILVLALGANDGLRGLSIEALRANLVNTIDLAHRNNIAVLLAGMQIPPNYGAQYMNAFSQIYRSLGAMDGVTFMPFLLADVAGNAHLNLTDGIHPNTLGHAIIANNLKPYLIKMLSDVPHR